jgi:hypothetical protein
MTADDLKAFATKDDLTALATKDDLKSFATREHLKLLATKADLDDVRALLSLRIDSVEDMLGTIAEHLAEGSQRLPPTA